MENKSWTFAIILLANTFCASQLLAQASGATESASDNIVIHGVLADSDGKPMTFDLVPGGVLGIFALPVQSEATDSSTLELSDETLNRNSAQPDSDGRFTLNIERNTIPAGMKLMVVVLLVGADGFQPLRFGDRNAVFEIDEATTELDLGTVVVVRK